MGQNSWMTELTEIDEFFGREPRYPIATAKQHLQFEMHKQNEIIKNNSSEIANGIIQSTNYISNTIEEGFTELFEINKNGFGR